LIIANRHLYATKELRM